MDKQEAIDVLRAQAKHAKIVELEAAKEENFNEVLRLRQLLHDQGGLQIHAYIHIHRVPSIHLETTANLTLPPLCPSIFFCSSPHFCAQLTSPRPFFFVSATAAQLQRLAQHSKQQQVKLKGLAHFVANDGGGVDAHQQAGDSSVGHLYAQSLLDNGSYTTSHQHTSMPLPMPPHQSFGMGTKSDFGKRKNGNKKTGRKSGQKGGAVKPHIGGKTDTVPNQEYTEALANRARQRQAEEALQTQNRTALARMREEEALAVAATREGRRLLQNRKKTEARMRRLAELDAQCQIEENGPRLARRLAAAEQEKREKQLTTAVQAFFRGCIERKMVTKWRAKVAARKQLEEIERRENEIKALKAQQKARAAVVLQSRHRRRQTTELSRLKAAQVKVAIWWRWQHFRKTNKSASHTRQVVFLQKCVRQHQAWQKHRPAIDDKIRRVFGARRMKECQKWIKVERKKGDERAKLALMLQRTRRKQQHQAARQTAATRLQNVQRRKLGERELQNRRQRKSGAEKIQSVHRRKRARSKVDALRQRQQEEAARLQEVEAARIKAEEARLQQMQAEDRQREEERRAGAVVVLQTSQRRVRAQKEKARLQKLQAAREAQAALQRKQEAENALAAVSIQQRYRGSSQRKRYGMQRAEEERRLEEEARLREEAAARQAEEARLQELENKRRRDEALQLQEEARRQQEDARQQREEEDARRQVGTRLQAVQRGRIGRREYQQRRVATGAAATTIQKSYRRKLAAGAGAGAAVAATPAIAGLLRRRSDSGSQSGEDGSGEDSSGEDGSGEDASGEDGSGEDVSGEDGSGSDDGEEEHSSNNGEEKDDASSGSGEDASSDDNGNDAGKVPAAADSRVRAKPSDVAASVKNDGSGASVGEDGSNEDGDSGGDEGESVDGDDGTSSDAGEDDGSTDGGEDNSGEESGNEAGVKKGTAVGREADVDEDDSGEDEDNSGEDEGDSGEDEDNSGEDEDDSGEDEGDSGEDEGYSGEDEDDLGENEGESGEDEGDPGENEDDSGEDEGSSGEDEDDSGEDEDSSDSDEDNLSTDRSDANKGEYLGGGRFAPSGQGARSPRK
jgi:hypothetical protein